VICFLGFPLAVHALQAGFLSRLRITNGFSLAAWGICLYKQPYKISQRNSQAAKWKLLVKHKWPKNICKKATCDLQAASVNNLKIMKNFVPCIIKLHL
jgi:hypothetical protein